MFSRTSSDYYSTNKSGALSIRREGKGGLAVCEIGSQFARRSGTHVASPLYRRTLVWVLPKEGHHPEIVEECRDSGIISLPALPLLCQGVGGAVANKGGVLRLGTRTAFEGNTSGASGSAVYNDRQSKTE